jgi:hypothetical protein
MKVITPVIDKIENKTVERKMKFLKWSAIIMLILSLLKIYMNPDIFNKVGSSFDFIIFLLPLYLFYEYRKNAKNWNGQFIEWNDNEIIYKTREEHTTILKYVQIQSIDIKLDEIILNTKEGEQRKIYIEDFEEYSDRVRIKKNFESLNNKLKIH